MADTNSAVQLWQHNAQSGVAAVALSADGETVIAGTLGKTVLCLDGAGHQSWQAKVGNQAWRIGLSTDGQTTVAGTGSTRPWDMKGRGLYCFAANGLLKWEADLKGSVWGLDVSADGNTIAAGTSSKQLLCFDGQGQRLWQQDVPGWGWYGWVFSAALSADGQTVAAVAADKQVRLLERSGQELAKFRTRGDLYIVAISADGQVVATGDTQGYAYLLNRQGHLLWEERLADKVWAVVLSTDGQRLLIGAGEKEKHLRAYDVAGRLLWRRYIEGSISSLALSANGQRVAAGTRDGGIYIFGQDGEVLHTARAGNLVRQVAISATGEQIVAGSEDGVVYGFQLPLLPTEVSVPASKEESIHQGGGTVYNIRIEKADHLAIGDYAQVQSAADKAPLETTSLPPYASLRLVRVRGEHRTYLIGEDKTRHWIPDGPTLETMTDWEDVEILANWNELAGFPPGRPLSSRVQGAKPWLVKVRGEIDVYLIDENEIRHRIQDKAALKLIDQHTEVDMLATWNELEKFQPGEPYKIFNIKRD